MLRKVKLDMAVLWVYLQEVNGIHSNNERTAPVSALNRSAKRRAGALWTLRVDMARTDDHKLSESTLILRQEFCTRISATEDGPTNVSTSALDVAGWGPTLRLSMLSLNRQAYSRNCTDVTTK